MIGNKACMAQILPLRGETIAYPGSADSRPTVWADGLIAAMRRAKRIRSAH